MTETERNKTIVRDFIDALFTRGDLSAVDTYLAEDYLDHDPPMGCAPDREGMRAAGRITRAGCPDWHSDLHRLVAEGDIVVEHFTAGGTHRGELLGVPPTGRTVTLRGINIFRVRDGVICERWGRLDDLGMLAGLGVVRTPDMAPAHA
ncbi:ester cyclase [Geodermatophilus sp. URMC 64]